MPIVVPGQSIPLDSDGRKSMQRALELFIDPALDQHRDVAANATLDWEHYDAKPFVKERTRPFRGASNMVIPLIATHADSIAARRLLTLFGTGDIWTSKSQNAAWRKKAKEYVNFLNSEADDNAFDLFTPMNDSILGSTVTGSGVLALQWGNRVKHRFAPGSKIPRTVMMHKGIHVLNVPRRQIGWQADRSLRESEYVFRITYMTRGDLIRSAEKIELGGAGWNRDEVAQVLRRAPTAESSGIYTAPFDLYDIRADGPEAFRPFEIIELWIEWPMLRGMKIPGPEDDNFSARPAIVVYFEKETRRILHVMAHPYPITHWPFYEFTYKRSGDYMGTRGVAKELSDLQHGISARANQAMDSATWANRILGLTNDPDLPGKIFGEGLIHTNMPLDATRFDVRNQPFIQPDMALIQFMLAVAERKTGQSDSNFGRETRSGGHPAPATSTLALLQQGQTVLSRTTAFDRQELSRLGEDILSLYQANEAAANGGRILRIIGAEDAEEVKELLFPETPLAGLLEMDVRAVSESNNAEAEFQRAVQVDQVITNYYSKVVQGLNVAIQATTAPPPFNETILKTAFQTLLGLTESVERILSAANVDDLEVFTDQLRDAIGQPMAAALEQVRLAAQSGLAAATGGAPSPAVATGPTGVPAAAAGPTPPPDREVR